MTNHAHKAALAAIAASALAGCSTLAPATHPYGHWGGAAAIQPLSGASFETAMLSAHNAERAAVGVAPLQWDAQLAASARAYADSLAASGAFQHAPKSARAGQGENLWMGTRGAYGLSAMVGSWASEKGYFIPGIFPNVSRTGNWADVGHYTQMIWRDTQRLGCGLGSSARSDVLVCRYAPGGNVDGRPVP